jgi:hypothetical protein
MIIERSCDIVIAANDVRVGAFTQLWLVESGILPREINAGAVFTPLVVNAGTATIQLTIVPNRIQLASRDEAATEELRTVSQRLIEKSDPGLLTLVAVGVNFRYVLGEKDGSAFAARTRRLLANVDSLEPFFSGHDARFGVFAIKTDGKLRTQLEIRTASRDNDGTEVVAVSINAQIETNSKDEVIAVLLKSFGDVRISSDRLASSIDKDLSP